MPIKKTKKICTSPSRAEELLQIHPHEIEPWRIFKIMAELVQGFEFLKKYKKAATFFGSARYDFTANTYKKASDLAYKLAKDKFAIVSGGGPGIMEAANKGAFEAGGQSVGLNIRLLKKDGIVERRNQFVKDSEVFDYFFVRKVMLSFVSQVYIFFPGGFGTLDELFEMITLVQTKKIPQIPIVLVDKQYWEPLLAWIKSELYEKNNAIAEKDMELYHLVDTAEEAYKLIKKLTRKKLIEHKNSLLENKEF